MEYRYLGKTGVRVSKLGLGTMTFGREADKAESAAMFGACRDAGVNLFDCADVYVDGVSETWLGEFIAPCRDQVVLCTKAYFPTNPDVNARGASRYHLVRAVEASLRRLKTDRIDVYYLHRFDDATCLEESLRAVEHLVQTGKVLYPAVSNFAAWQVARALGIAERWGFSPLVAVQPMYNLVKRQAEVEILPMAQAERLAVIPYSPLGGGLLTGRYGGETKEGRLKVNKMYATRYEQPHNFEVAAKLREIARREGVVSATLAVAWVAAHPGVTAPLIGARNVEQLRPSLDAAQFQLSPELYEEISSLSPAPPPATDRTEERTPHTMNVRG